MSQIFTQTAMARSLLEVRNRWLCPTPPVSAEDLELLAESSGFFGQHLKEALARAFIPYTKQKITTMVRKGFSSVQNPPTLFAILQGRIFALTTSIVYKALSANYRVILKPSSVEPLFATLFRRSLETINSPLGSYVDVVSPDDRERISVLLRRADVCIAYGRDETIREIIKARGGLRTFGFGHMESFIVLFREALRSKKLDRLARAIAVDCSIYDQDGCLSPGLVFVEEGGECSLEDLCEAIYHWMSKLFVALPPRRLSLDEATVLSQRVHLAFAQAKNSGGLVLKPNDAIFPAVILVREQPLQSKVGYRAVVLFPFSRTLKLESVFPSLLGRIQGIAFAGPKKRMEEFLLENPDYKPHYMARVGFLQHPPADWLENGIDLVEQLRNIRVQKFAPAMS